ncbi:MAG: insulinase family protein [Chitinophagaceae bacterium]|nr:insulinase family protein [Chitinophagaceae bacterium]
MHKTKLLLHSLWLLLFTFTTQLSFSQFELNGKLIIDPDVKIGKLSNGLTYYIKKNTKPEKKVQLRLVVNAGSVLEQPDQQGLAHMMEHMNFNGSTHFQKNELVSYLQSIGVKFGADLNAYTGFDETVYILPIPSDDPDKIDKGFTILADWAGNALLDTAEINKERGVVLEESRLGKGAGERMGKKYFPELFNGSRYSERLPIGKDSILQNFKAESLVRFYKTWYRPDLMAVVVVGDIDPALAEQEIIKHFSQFKNPAQEIPRPSIIPIAERNRNTGMVLTDKEQTLKLLQVYNYVEKAKPIDTWAKYRETIVEGIFNSLINQRLNDLTQQPDPPFLFGSTSFGNFIRGYRAFISFAAIGDKPVKNAIDALINTTESVKKFGFLQSELDRAKASLLNQTEKAFADKDKTESALLVQGYINNYLSGTPITGITNRYAFIKQILPTITLAEVNELSKKIESKQGKFALLLAPEKSTADLPSDNDLLKLVADAHNLPVKPYQEKAVATTLMIKKPIPGKVTGEKTNTVLGTTDLTLSNGVTVTLKPTEFKNDEIQMDAWRWGGTHNYGLADKQNAGNAASIIRSMGVSDMSPTDLRKFLSGKTVTVQPYVSADDEGIEGSSSVKDFETFLQLVNLYFTQPRKDQSLFQSYISTQKGFVENMKANPASYFSDTLSKIEYNNNPWAPGLAQVSDYDKINLDRTLNIYKSIFGNAYGMHFTFVGNIDVNKIKPLLETYLGSLPSSKKENKYTDVGLRPIKGIVQTTIYKGAAKQSRVNLIFTGEAPYSQDENLKLKTLLDALNIKFIEKLREDMGGIYGGGMSGSIINRPYNHYTITVSFPCGPENVDKLTTAALDLIKNAQANEIEQSYLDKVKETLKKQYQDKVKQNDFWLDGLSLAWIERDDPIWLLDYSKKVDALTVQDLQQAAKKYFNMNNYIKAVLNPEK